jgi:transcriptional regulator with GAF, ATPase, and Fis domain
VCVARGMNELRRAIETLPPPDTMAALRELTALLEERTLRRALEAMDWVPEAAARYLGCAAGSSLQRALARHPALVHELAARRTARRDGANAALAARRGANGATHADA